MKFDSTRTHDKNEVNAIFDMVFLILVIQFQRGNVFFSFCNLSCSQIIGVPILSSSACFMANLSLYYYNNKWLLETKNIDLKKAGLDENLYHFTDGLRNTNKNLEFDKNYI